MQAQGDWLRPSIHPVYARLICAELQRRGFSEEAILQGTRLQWDELYHSGLFLSFEQARRLIVRAIDLTQCPWLGLNVGLNTQLSAHGALGSAGMAASTVGVAMTLMQRYLEVRLRFVRLDIVSGQAGFSMVLIEDLMAPDVREFIVANIAAVITQNLEGVAGHRVLDRVAIHWPFAVQAWSQHYLDFCPKSQFGATQLRVDIPHEVWNLPGIAADPVAFRTALRECEQQASQLEKGSVTTRLQQRLLLCGDRYPSLEDMAALEHVSPRTLIRHLRDEGMTYQRLQDSVREELACWLLGHTPLSVEVIAARLGYQDTSNFSRAFRRWLGVTPRDFRQSHLKRFEVQ